MTNNIQLHPDYNLDTDGALKFDESVKEIKDGSSVKINLSNVEFVASSGLRVLLKLAKRLDLTLSNVHPPVMLVLKVSGLDTIFNIED